MVSNLVGRQGSIRIGLHFQAVAWYWSLTRYLVARMGDTTSTALLVVFRPLAQLHPLGRCSGLRSTNPSLEWQQRLMAWGTGWLHPMVAYSPLATLRSTDPPAR